MKEEFKKQSLIMIIFTFVLSICLGLVLLFATEDFLQTLNYIFVIIFAIIGVTQIISFIINKDYKYLNYSGLTIGILSIWLALFSYQYYYLFVIILPVILSLYAFIIAIIFIIKCCTDKTKINIILAVLSVIMGVFLIFRPILSTFIYFRITGVYIIIIAIIGLVEYIRYKKKKK